MIHPYEIYDIWYVHVRLHIIDGLYSLTQAVAFFYWEAFFHFICISYLVMLGLILSHFLLHIIFISIDSSLFKFKKLHLATFIFEPCFIFCSRSCTCFLYCLYEFDTKYCIFAFFFKNNNIYIYDMAIYMETKVFKKWNIKKEKKSHSL